MQDSRYTTPESLYRRFSHKRQQPRSARNEYIQRGSSRPRGTKGRRSLYYNRYQRKRQAGNPNSPKSRSMHPDYLRGAVRTSSLFRGHGGQCLNRDPVLRRKTAKSFHGGSSAQMSSRCGQRHRRSQSPRLLLPPEYLNPITSSLEGWRRLVPAEIIKRLNHSRFEELFENEVVDKSMEILVGAIGKACDNSRGPECIHEVLTLLHRKKFLELQMNPWIADSKYNEPLSDLQTETIEWAMLLLRGMIQEVPESISSVENSVAIITMFLQDTKICKSTVLSKLSALIDSLKSSLGHPHKSQQLVTCKKVVSGTPQIEASEDFRNLSIIPTSSELQNDYKPFLRPNVVNGCFDSVHHYLDVHFRLLREDFIRPLRESIARYLTEINSERKTEMEFLTNLRMFDNVRAIEVKPSRDGFVYVLQFKVNYGIKRVRWEGNKRLLFGSLVCLSRDDFKTIIFGYVVNRDIRELRQGRVGVAFDISNDEFKELVSDFDFKMAESSSYFEAYRHVLKSLQTIPQGTFPLKQYLISISNDVRLPKYVRENPDVLFTLCSNHIVKTDKEPEREETSKPLPASQLNTSQVQIGLESNWPCAEELGFDNSQMEAYKAALTEELCLIQGPPGTGKTYVGLKIVETLLKNDKHWDRKPLMVVCFTNHALDQFLERILQKTTRVVRIGSRTSSHKIKEVSLNRLLRERNLKNCNLRRQYSALRQKLEKCVGNMGRINYCIKMADKKILKCHLLHSSMSGSHLKCLLRFKQENQGTDVLLDWLCIVDRNGRWNGRPSQDHNHNKQNKLGSGNETDYQFADDEDDFDGLHLDDEDDFIRDILDSVDNAENIVVEIPDHYINQHGKRVPQPNREQIDEFIEKMLLEPDVMTREDAFIITNICDLNVEERWRLYRFWVKSFIEQMHLKLLKEQQKFRIHKKSFDAFILREQMDVLQDMLVVGVTTTGAAKHHQLLRQIGPPVVIVEEAAEVLEAHVIASLTCSCQHLILIGDHQQLRPNPTVYDLCKYYKLDVSLFERLIKNGISCHRLLFQHRMRPEISHLLKIHEDFYPGLCDHQLVEKYEGIRGIQKDVFFIDHDCPEQGNDESKSSSNLHEAAFIISLCNYLLQQGYNSEQITILAAYQGQVRNIKELRKIKGIEEVHVSSIDNFQGEENDIILISFVRSNEEGNIGFLKVPNRVCVALSRAKKGLYCIGNFTLMSQHSRLWEVITKDLRKRELIGRNLKLMCRNHLNKFTEVSYACDFEKVPDGGCSEPCTGLLICGHPCQKNCHPEGKEHRDIRCMNRCDRKCDAQIHKCKKLCFEECEAPCTEKVKKVLSCSHEQLVDCYIETEKAKCRVKCEEVLPCNHQCQEMCFEKCTEKCGVMITKIFQPCGHQSEVACFQTECPQTCDMTLKCGHVCSGTCGECKNGRFHVRCEVVCKRILVCGHERESKCCSTCSPCRRRKNWCEHSKCTRHCGESCSPCIEPCSWKCRHMRCNRKCGDKCDRKPCDRSCRMKLKCGHRCIGLCGEPCPPLCRVCDKSEATEVVWGDVNQPGAKFIYLEECRHVVDVEAMDQFMSTNYSSDHEKRFPECPKCKKPIRFNPRYNDRIKTIRSNVEKVKQSILGHGDTFDEKFFRLKVRLYQLICGLNSYTPTNLIDSATLANDAGKKMNVKTVIETSGVRLYKEMKNNLEERGTLVTFDDLLKIEMQLDMFDKLQDLYKVMESELDDTFANHAETVEQTERLQEDYIFLLNKLESSVLVTEQEIEDWQREYKRCCHRITFVRVLKIFTQPGVKLEDLKKEKGMLDEAEKLLSDGGKFSDNKDWKVGEILKELKTRNPLLDSIGITDEERDMVKCMQ